MFLIFQVNFALFQSSVRSACAHVYIVLFPATIYHHWCCVFLPSFPLSHPLLSPLPPSLLPPPFLPPLSSLSSQDEKLLVSYLRGVVMDMALYFAPLDSLQVTILELKREKRYHSLIVGLLQTL